MEWDDLEKACLNKAKNIGDAYFDKLKFEFKEITKQGSNQYWIDLIKSGKNFEHNKNGLVLPYVLGITNVDPIESGIEHNIKYQPDFPDIDIDFLPFARDPVKEYVKNVYGDSRVCSVGSWITYKPKSAIKDALRALGSQDDKLTDKQFERDMYKVLDELPDEFDEMDEDAAKDEYANFKEFSISYSKIIDLAYKMVGRIKSQGKHAGGLIIASQDIGDFVPLAYDHKLKQRVSTWTEGFNQQLSRFGFVKFDVLGLRTMQDIFIATNYVKENRNVDIDWDYMDPQLEVLGRYRHGDGEWIDITMKDEKILKLCNTQKVETVFQFETDFAMGILKEIGIKWFWDVVAATSLGRPGPMEQIPNYVHNRDDPNKSWKHGLPDKLIDILNTTNGVIIFQEQLQRIWTEMCGLTVPEAEKARKAVAKKKAEELMKLEPRVVSAMAKYDSKEFAEKWWEMMTKFGRYAFNLSHAAAYSVISWRCLFLKSYFQTEWWASVLSHAKPERRAKYVGLARLDGIEFGSVNINNLRSDFNVNGDAIAPGLSVIKNIGKKAANDIADLGKTNFADIDEFMEFHSYEADGKKRYKVNKTIMGRLIKLGAFDNIHKNRKALWYWYVYQYTSPNDTKKKVKKLADAKYYMTDEEIQQERQKMIKDWRSTQKKKDKQPPKRILQWKQKKVKYTKQQIMDLVKKDYTIDELLQIEKEYYGFYWNSPLSLYITNGNTIEVGKVSGIIECVIEDLEVKKTQAGNDYIKLVVTDGLESVYVNMFSNVLMITDQSLLVVGNGVRIEAEWSDKFRSFTCARDRQILGLVRQDEYDEFHNIDKDSLVDDDEELVDSNEEEEDEIIEIDDVDVAYKDD